MWRGGAGRQGCCPLAHAAPTPQYIDAISSKQGELEGYVSDGYKTALTEERRRFCFLVEKQCAVAKHSAAYHSKVGVPRRGAGLRALPPDPTLHPSPAGQGAAGPEAAPVAAGVCGPQQAPRPGGAAHAARGQQRCRLAQRPLRLQVQPAHLGPHPRGQAPPRAPRAGPVCGGESWASGGGRVSPPSPPRPRPLPSLHSGCRRRTTRPP